MTNLWIAPSLTVLLVTVSKYITKGLTSITMWLSLPYPLVEAGGIEPPLEEPKSSVLPLNYASIIIGLTSSYSAA